MRPLSQPPLQRICWSFRPHCWLERFTDSQGRRLTPDPGNDCKSRLAPLRPRFYPLGDETISAQPCDKDRTFFRSEEHTSELQSLMRISYAVFCLKKKNQNT